MAMVEAEGISQHYELLGRKDGLSVLLISGLGGVGASWGPQIDRFAADHQVILPDQRGTGRTSRAGNGYTTRQLAADLAALVRHVGVGPVHVVGASTGGAIAQHMALDNPELVRSLTISSSFARFDAFMHRQFEVRAKMAAEWDRPAMFAGYSLFLFSPRFTRHHPEVVQDWIDRATSHPANPADREIGLKRIAMIAAHDAFARLSEITAPTLVVCGEQNHCTPLPLSEEIAGAVRGARLVVLEDAGELIELEAPKRFYELVSTFIAEHA